MLLDNHSGLRLPDSSPRNSAGQTAADLATISSAVAGRARRREHPPAAERAAEVGRQHGRTLLLRECAEWLIPDLAALVLDFVDGVSGPPSSADRVCRLSCGSA